MSAPVGQAKFDYRGEAYRRTRCRSDVLSDYDFSTINDLDVEWFSVAGSNGDNGNGVNRGFVSDSQDGPDLTGVALSDFDEDIALLKEDAVFQSRVTRKMKVYLINRQEAEVETLLDHIVQNQGGADEALLYVISAVYNEMKVQTLTRILLNRGASPLVVDSERKTPLHHSVMRGFYGVCLRLLESEVDPLAADKDGLTPFDWALRDKNDAIAALILQYVPARTVRSKFSAPNQSGKTAEYSYHDLIKESMHKTAVSVLDCTLEPCSTTGKFKIHFHIQEADDKGRAPGHPDYRKENKSSFQLISETGKAELGLHDAVRLLVRRKWKLYAKFRFQMNAMLFLFSTMSLTYVAVLASLVQDPCVYNTPLQISRAAAEVIVITVAAYVLLLELVQMKRNGLDYWRDRYNWQDLLSTLLILIVIPLRVYQINAQWIIFSLGYLMWTMRVFKYAPIFAQTGAYAQTLWHVVAHDFPQFIVLFMVILLAFSGSFLLALKGEGLLGKHEETDSFWHILYTGVRTFIEGEKVVEYTGDDKYGTLGSILMVCFLLTVNILLLNILIAQLSDAYQNVQHEAKRALILNRATIVTRVEINSMFTGTGFRCRFYKEIDEVDNLTKALSQWDTNGINSNNSSKGITDQMEVQEQSLFTIKNRLIRQEQRVVNQSRQLDRLQLDMKRLLDLTLRGTTSPDLLKNGTMDSRIAKAYQEKPSASNCSNNSGEMSDSFHSSDLLEPFNATLYERREFQGIMPQGGREFDPKCLRNGEQRNGVDFEGIEPMRSFRRKADFIDDQHQYDLLGRSVDKALIQGQAATRQETNKGVEDIGEGTSNTGQKLSEEITNLGTLFDEAIGNSKIVPPDIGAQLDEAAAILGVQLADVKVVEADIGKPIEGIHTAKEVKDEEEEAENEDMMLHGTVVQSDVVTGTEEADAAVEERISMAGNTKVDPEESISTAGTREVGLAEGSSGEAKEPNISQEDVAAEAMKQNTDEELKTWNEFHEEVEANFDNKKDDHEIAEQEIVDDSMDDQGLIGADRKLGVDNMATERKVSGGSPDEPAEFIGSDRNVGVDNDMEETAGDNMDEQGFIGADTDFGVDNDMAELVEKNVDTPVRVDEVALDMEIMEEPVEYTDTAKLLVEQEADTASFGFPNQGVDNIEPS